MVLFDLIETHLFFLADLTPSNIMFRWFNDLSELKILDGIALIAPAMSSLKAALAPCRLLYLSTYLVGLLLKQRKQVFNVPARFYSP